MQRQIIEAVLLNTKMLLSYLKSATEFSEDEFTNLENFFKIKLQSVIYNKPDKEVQIQNAIENLLVGKDGQKGLIMIVNQEKKRVYS